MDDLAVPGAVTAASSYGNWLVVGCSSPKGHAYSAAVFRDNTEAVASLGIHRSPIEAIRVFEWDSTVFCILVSRERVEMWEVGEGEGKSMELLGLVEDEVGGGVVRDGRLLGGIEGVAGGGGWVLVGCGGVALVWEVDYGLGGARHVGTLDMGVGISGLERIGVDGFVSGNLDGRVKLWGLNPPRMVWEGLVGRSCSVDCLCSVDEGVIGAGLGDGRLSLMRLVEADEGRKGEVSEGSRMVLAGPMLSLAATLPALCSLGEEEDEEVVGKPGIGSGGGGNAVSPKRPAVVVSKPRHGRRAPKSSKPPSLPSTSWDSTTTPIVTGATEPVSPEDSARRSLRQAGRRFAQCVAPIAIVSKFEEEEDDGKVDLVGGDEMSSKVLKEPISSVPSIDFAGGLSGTELPPWLQSSNSPPRALMHETPRIGPEDERSSVSLFGFEETRDVLGGSTPKIAETTPKIAETTKKPSESTNKPSESTEKPVHRTKLVSSGCVVMLACGLWVAVGVKVPSVRGVGQVVVSDVAAASARSAIGRVGGDVDSLMDAVSKCEAAASANAAKVAVWWRGRLWARDPRRRRSLVAVDDLGSGDFLRGVAMGMKMAAPGRIEVDRERSKATSAPRTRVKSSGYGSERPRAMFGADRTASKGSGSRVPPRPKRQRRQSFVREWEDEDAENPRPVGELHAGRGVQVLRGGGRCLAAGRSLTVCGSWDGSVALVRGRGVEADDAAHVGAVVAVATSRETYVEAAANAIKPKSVWERKARDTTPASTGGPVGVSAGADGMVRLCVPGCGEPIAQFAPSPLSSSSSSSSSSYSSTSNPSSFSRSRSARRPAVSPMRTGAKLPPCISAGWTGRDAALVSIRADGIFLARHSSGQGIARLSRRTAGGPEPVPSLVAKWHSSDEFRFTAGALFNGSSIALAATSRTNRTIALWDLSVGMCTSTLGTHLRPCAPRPANLLAFPASDPRLLLAVAPHAASADPGTRAAVHSHAAPLAPAAPTLWDLRFSTAVLSVPVALPTSPGAPPVAIDPFANLVAVGDERGNVILFDMRNSARPYQTIATPLPDIAALSFTNHQETPLFALSKTGTLLQFNPLP